MAIFAKLASMVASDLGTGSSAGVHAASKNSSAVKRMYIKGFNYLLSICLLTYLLQSG